MFTIDFYNKRKHREATKIIKLYHQYNDLHQVSSDTMSSTAEFHKHRAEYATQYRENLNRDFSNWLSTTSFIAHDPSISIGTVPVGFFKALFYSQQLTSLYERPMGSVMSCGLNEGGLQGIPQLDGDKGTDQSTDFIPINNLPSNIIQLVAGSTYSLALSDEGIIYAWGDNGEGQCGRAWWNSEPTDDTDYANILSPYMIELDERIIAISAGDAHTLALSLHGSCYFFGTYRLENGSHLRDIGKNPNDPLYQKELQMLEEKDEDQENEKTFPKPPHGEQFLPIKISIPENVIKIDSGSSFNAVLTRDGVCYTWGVGDFFGRNITGAYDLTPKSISWFDEDYLARSKYQRIVRDMACGGSHILVVAQDSNSSHWSVYSAGNNLYGQLGLGFRVAGQTTEEKPKSLTKIHFLEKKYIAHVAAGSTHSLCLDITGRHLYSFGSNSFGQLGSNTPAGMSKFECIPQLVYLNHTSSLSNSDRTYVNPTMKSISCGEFHSLVVTTDGDLYTWGLEESGRLGHGNEESCTRPKKVIKTSNIKVLEADGGANHSLILVDNVPRN